MTVAIRNTWEHFAHGADVGIRGIGPTKEAAFQQIALGLTSVITDLERIDATIVDPPDHHSGCKAERLATVLALRRDRPSLMAIRGD